MDIKKKSLMLLPGPWTLIAVISIYVIYLLLSAVLN
ncbi:hypothetical protein SAMN06269250_1936 [Spirosoma fluviale]|uniref:Uncharacterized protein n=1 Tax=Spirosoma fluviale TaxID=1597977 RepID=A0A286FF76_9BACT|nr:hypothetical protein SAMN06269250_1936 [Spirosoma fluviale]